MQSWLFRLQWVDLTLLYYLFFYVGFAEFGLYTLTNRSSLAHYVIQAVFLEAWRAAEFYGVGSYTNLMPDRARVYHFMSII